MLKCKVPMTLAETREGMQEIRRRFEAAVAAGDPEAIAAKKRIDEAARRMRKALRLPRGYEFRHIGPSR